MPVMRRDPHVQHGVHTKKVKKVEKSKQTSAVSQNQHELPAASPTTYHNSITVLVCLEVHRM